MLQDYWPGTKGIHIRVPINIGRCSTIDTILSHLTIAVLDDEMEEEKVVEEAMLMNIYF